MRGKVLVGFLVACALTSVTRSGRPVATPADPRRDQVAVRVGPRAVTVGEIEDRLAAMAPFQLAGYGATPEQIRKRFVDEVIVPELLLSLGAEEQKLAEKLPASQEVLRALSSATLRAVRAEVGPAPSIPQADVQRFYDENRSRYDSPERLQLWRILTKTREEAQSILETMKVDGSVKRWNDLAREKSLDKATNLRGGNLGFVGPDGASSEHGLRVDPALPKAAAAVKDGELVPTPIPEGPNFAVTWRRGTVGASRRSLEDAAPQIRDTLWRQRVEQAERRLTETLRAQKVKDVNVDLLQGLDVSAGQGVIVPRRRPGQVPGN